ncbi:MAG: nucleotide exchange factor GrpE, partial [Bradymonadaceae bacterium]
WMNSTAGNDAIGHVEQLYYAYIAEFDFVDLRALNRRIEELGRDLRRLQERSSETVAGARRQERVRLLSGLGDVLDSVERALTLGETESPWRAGLEAIRSQFHAYLRDHGATLTGKVGERLDPHIHQAIAVVDSPAFEAGQIAEVDRHGLELEDGTVVRPALVIVAR